MPPEKRTTEMFIVRMNSQVNNKIKYKQGLSADSKSNQASELLSSCRKWIYCLAQT
jgi:hypothetical protein